MQWNKKVGGIGRARVLKLALGALIAGTCVIAAGCGGPRGGSGAAEPPPPAPAPAGAGAAAPGSTRIVDDWNIPASRAAAPAAGAPGAAPATAPSPAPAASPAASAPALPVTGALSTATSTTVEGYAFDPKDLTVKLQVQLMVNGAPTARATANLEDVAGTPAPGNGFRFTGLNLAPGTNIMVDAIGRDGRTTLIGTARIAQAPGGANPPAPAPAAPQAAAPAPGAAPRAPQAAAPRANPGANPGNPRDFLETARQSGRRQPGNAPGSSTPRTRPQEPAAAATGGGGEGPTSREVPGTIVTRADGSQGIVDTNGRVVSADGARAQEIFGKNGWGFQAEDGTRTWLYPDGMKITTWPDGSQSVERSDGTVTEYDRNLRPFSPAGDDYAKQPAPGSMATDGNDVTAYDPQGWGTDESGRAFTPPGDDYASRPAPGNMATDGNDVTAYDPQGWGTDESGQPFTPAGDDYALQPGGEVDNPYINPETGGFWGGPGDTMGGESVEESGSEGYDDPGFESGGGEEAPF